MDSLLTQIDFIWKRIYEWKKTRRIYKFRCKCWKEKYIRPDMIKKWKIISCWCRMWHPTHHMSDTRFFRIWVWMYERCNNNKRKEYIRYWWRWIECLRNTFEEFKNDMYESYKKHMTEYWKIDTTIDRINNNWNYYKENCRRATRREQIQNSRIITTITIDWISKSIVEWGKFLWVRPNLISKRISRGRSLERAIKEKII